MSRKRINRTERRAILRCLGKLTLAVVALVDGATPDEIISALQILDELVTTFRRAVSTIEDADDAADGY